MVQARLNDARLAEVIGEVRVESASGPYTVDAQTLRSAQAGLEALLNSAMRLLAAEGGYRDVMPAIKVSHCIPRPGTYLLVLTAVDRRPWAIRLVAAAPAPKRMQIRNMLRWASEMLSVTVQVVPPITLADHARASSSPDADGFGTMILDDRRTYRVPTFMLRLFQRHPELIDDVTALIGPLRLPDLSSVVIVRDPDDPMHRQEHVIALSDEFHRRVLEADYASLLAKVEFEEAPLREVTTRNQRRQVFGTGIAGLDRSS